MEEKLSKRDSTTANVRAEILPFEMGYLPDYFLKKGEREIGYTQNIREKSLRELKEVLASGDDSIYNVPFSDECLLVILSCRKYDVDKVVTQLKKMLNFKRKEEILFKVPSFDVLSVFMTSELVTVLPWRCQDGCTLILIQLGKCNSVQHPVEAIKQFYALMLIQCLREPMTQVNGFKVIIDLNITLEVLKICTPHNLYVFYYGTLVILPARFKGIHIVNMSTRGKIVWKIISYFLPNKIKERTHFHAAYDTLLDFFPKAVLPAKCGGDLKEYDMTDWLRRATSPEELKWVTGSLFEFQNTCSKGTRK